MTQDKISTFSTTGIGIAIVTILQVVLPMIFALFGAKIEAGSSAEIAQGIVTVIGGIIALYGQFTRTDLKFGLMRKNA